MRRRHLLPITAVLTTLLGAVAIAIAGPARSATDNEACRPDGLYRTPGPDVPYCQVYDTAGREKMSTPRRVIGYFTGWRTGKDGSPAYLARDIPWSNLTHVNYAFAHIDGANKVSVGSNLATNPAIGMEWPGVAGAEMDPALPYKGHFNLLNKFKKQNPNVKTLVSIGGWAETGGYFADNGSRVASGGYYTMTDGQNGINTFADSVVAFVRQYGFNGADIDYEFATSMNYAGNPVDFGFSNARRPTLMRGYVTLMKTLREKLDAASAADGRYYMLTAAVSASGWILRGAESYQVTQYLDYANVMTYDMHGTWNQYVGPNAALYDDGRDAELAFWNVYGVYGMGYLNTDWAYHYFRGAMQSGRINIGLPFYTRGWQGVSGGTSGLWGTAPLPNQSQCPPGTGSSVGSTVPCGNGAVGIDNLWHDNDTAGHELASGSNPMWHAKNLQQGITGDYLRSYGLDPTNDPADRLTGTYARNYNSTLVSPWLWNDQKKVFLSTEDDTSVAAKADYVVSKGLGGIMFWELAGDYAFDSAKNQYFMGPTLTTLIHNKFAGAAPYGNTRAGGTMPTDVLDVKVDLINFPTGDSNYPISPTMRITNNSTQTITGGGTLQFDYGTSAPATMNQQSGWSITNTAGHTGGNVGGLRGDFQHATLGVPSWMSIAPGATADVALTYQLPIATPSNFILTFGGKSYRLTQDNPRGGTGPSPSVTATGSPSRTASASPSVTPSRTTSPSVPPSSSPPGGSGVVNGGFETGSLAPWTCTGNLGSVVSSPVHSGTRALSAAVSSSDIAQCSQTVAVQPGRTYTLSGWVNGNYVYLGVTGTGTSDASTWTPGTGGAYSKLSVPFTTGAGTTSVTVWVHGWYAQGTYNADDIAIT